MSKAPVEFRVNVDSDRQSRLERRLAALRDHREWSGYLCLENAEAVADRIRSMIGNGQRYTFVDCNELFGYRPEVRPSQVAKNIRFADDHPDEDGHRYAHIGVSDSWSWGLMTEAETEDDARHGEERRRIFLKFTHRQILIDHYTIAGSHLYWVVALEDEPEDGQR